MKVFSQKSKLLCNKLKLNLSRSSLINGNFVFFEYNIFRYYINQETLEVFPLVFEIQTSNQNEIEMFCYTKNELMLIPTESQISQSDMKSITSKKDVHDFFAFGLMKSDVRILKYLFGECDINIKINSIFVLFCH